MAVKEFPFGPSPPLSTKTVLVAGLTTTRSGASRTGIVVMKVPLDASTVTESVSGVATNTLPLTGNTATSSGRVGRVMVNWIELLTASMIEIVLLPSFAV